MKEIDGMIREAVRKESFCVPESVHQRVEETLASLPERNIRKKMSRIRLRRTQGLCAACFVLLFLFVLPNVSAVYAAAAAKIPVIGQLVRVFTVRSYADNGETYELSADIPAVEDEKNTDAAEALNADIETLTQKAIDAFYAELGEGFASLCIDYETVTDTPAWFTLRITAEETAASGYACAKYYHIDREAGNLVTFGDLFDSEGMAAVAEVILGKMKEEMAADSEMIYWVGEITVDKEMLLKADERADPGILIGTEDSVQKHPSGKGETVSIVLPSEKIPCVRPDQNFYFREDGAMVVVYGEYTVAPGFMGCPEIVLTQEEYAPYLRNEAERAG
ncbi:MAG: DUF3298 domain-containing protein [Clostridia bacterium]|nr:DUF3298 domain-containing protein [Clostridia bacterium]